MTDNHNTTPTGEGMSSERLDDMLLRRSLARKEVTQLCRGKSWTMCVPPQRDDSDMVLCAALDDNLELIAEVRRLQGLARIGENLYDKACVFADRVWNVFAIEVDGGKLTQWPELDSAYREYRVAFKAYEVARTQTQQQPNPTGAEGGQPIEEKS